jgi:hypothetical protein
VDKHTYKMIQQQILMLGHAVEGMDLAGFCEMAQSSLTTSMFFVSPVAYQTATPRVQKMIKAARALQQFQAAWLELRELVGEQEASGVADLARGMMRRED